MKKLAKILIPVFVLALVMSCVFIFASAEDNVASVTVGETTTEYATLAEAVAAANAESGNGAVVKLLKDVMVTESINVSSVDFTLDLNGHRLGWNNTGDWKDTDEVSKAIFVFSVPEGEEEATPLITGNGKIHLRNSALFKTATAADAEFVSVNIGAREALDEDYNPLDEIPALDTQIILNQIGGARTAILTNDGDTLYMQNVQLFFEDSNDVSDKPTGGAARFAITTDNSYIRLVNSEIQEFNDSPTSTPKTQNIFSMGGTADSFVRLDGSYARIYGGLLDVRPNVSGENLFIMNDSTVIAHDRFDGKDGTYGTASSAGFLFNLGGANATSVGNFVVNNSYVTAYRTAEGDNDSIGLKLVTTGSTYRQVMHHNNNVFARAGISIDAKDCFFNLGKSGFLWSLSALTDPDPTFSFDNCRFNQKPTGNAAVVGWNDKGYYDFSNAEYPYVVGTRPEGAIVETAPVYSMEMTGDNKSTTASGFFTDNIPKTFTYGKMYPAETADGNGYVIYKVTDGDKTYGSVNNPTDPYFGIGPSLSTGKSYPIYSLADQKWTGRTFIYEFDFAAGVNGFTNSFISIIARTGCTSSTQSSPQNFGRVYFKDFAVTAGSTTITVKPEEWHHYTAVVAMNEAANGYTATIYIDGVKVHTESMNKTAATGDTCLETARWNVSGGNIAVGSAIAFDNVRARIYEAGATFTAVPTTFQTGYTTHEAEVGGKFYNTLSDALAAAKSSYDVITLKKDVVTKLKLEDISSSKTIFYQKYEAYRILSSVEGIDEIVDSSTGNVYGPAWSRTAPGGSAIANFACLEPGFSDIYGGGYYVYPDTANLLRKATYGIYDTDGNIVSYGTDADSFWNAFDKLADGQTLKLFDNVSRGKGTSDWNTAGARVIDLNGHRITKTEKGRLINLYADNSSLTITSSAPGGEIIAYKEFAYTSVDFTYTTNYGEALFSAEGANQTIKIDGANLTIAAANLFDTAITNKEAPKNNIKLEINGGTYVQLGKDCWGFIMVRNSAEGEAMTAIDIKNANFIDSSDKYTECIFISLYADADGVDAEENATHRRPAAKITIDNCSFTALHEQNEFLQRLVNGSTVTVTNTSFAGYYFDLNATEAPALTYGAGVTSSLPLQAGASYAEGCGNYALLIPVENKLIGTVTANSMRGVYNGVAEKGTIYIHYNDGTGPNIGLSPEGSIGGVAAVAPIGTPGFVPLFTARGEDTLERLAAYGYNGLREYTGYATIEEETITLTAQNNAAYTSDGANLLPINYTLGGETVATLYVPADTAEDVIKNTSPAISGGIDGLCNISSWKVTSLTKAENVYTAVVEPESVTNTLKVSSTLVLQDNLIYTVLLRADMLKYVNEIKLAGEVVYTKGQAVETVIYGDVEYFAVQKALAPSEAGAEFTYAVVYNANGVEHSANWTFSIAKYAEAVLAAEGNATVNGEAKQLVAEVLNYVKVLADYAGEDVDANVEAAIAAYTEAGFAPAEIETPASDAVVDLENVSGIGLKISAEGFKFYMTFDEGFSGTVNVKIGEQTYAADASVGEFTVAVHAYALVRDITVGEQTYNLESYFEYMLNDNIDATEAQIALVNAIKAYAVAADAYVNSMAN